MEEKGQQGKDRVSPASISALPLHGEMYSLLIYEILRIHLVIMRNSSVLIWGKTIDFAISATLLLCCLRY